MVILPTRPSLGTPVAGPLQRTARGDAVCGEVAYRVIEFLPWFRQEAPSHFPLASRHCREAQVYSPGRKFLLCHRYAPDAEEVISTLQVVVR